MRPTRPTALNTRAQGVALQIRNLIIGGGLKPGDRLPTERALAELFVASRTVIREAIKGLEAKGILEGQAGSGTFVAQGNPEAVSELWGLSLHTQPRDVVRRKVFEIRGVLESEVACLAAERASDEDIAQLQSILSRQEMIRSDREAFETADAEFHATLARATKNECFSLMLVPLAQLLLETREWSKELPGELESVLWHHARILKTVEEHDCQAARRAMHEHIRQAAHMQVAWSSLVRQAGLNQEDAAKLIANPNPHSSGQEGYQG
jgi:GntR family transcriptional regulator, transcriptional repressor for pyruvate dehydrogenase complex